MNETILRLRLGITEKSFNKLKMFMPELQKIDSNDEIKLYTDVGRLKVNDSLDVEEVGFVKNLTLLQQWEERIKSDWDNKTDDLKSTIQALEDRIKELETNGGQGGFQLQIITLEESD